MKTIQILSILSLFVGGLATISTSCKEEEELECESTTTISFSADVEPIFTASCNTSGCHRDGFSAGDFTDFDEIKGKVSGGTLKSRLVDRSMPSNKTLSDSDLQKLLCWIDQGAENN
jgi:hypothetical protein